MASGSNKAPYAALLAQISEVLDRAADGRLSGEEAASRLDAIARSQTATDYARDAYGKGADARTVIRDRLNNTLGYHGQAQVRSVQEEKAAEALKLAAEEQKKAAEEQKKAAEAQTEAARKQAAFERRQIDSRGQVASQFLRGDFQGAFSTQARAKAQAAENAGDVLKAESILAGASKVNAAFGIAAAAADLATKGLNIFRGSIEQAGDQSRKFIANDYFGYLTGAVEGAAKSMEQIPIVGQLQAAAFRTAIAPVNEFAKTVEAFVARGRELSRFNAGLAAANAAADTRRVLDEANEAERLGPALSRLTDSESRLESSFREIMLPIKSLLADILADLVEPLADIIGIAKPAVVTVLDLLKMILDAVRKLNPANRVREGLSWLRKQVDGEEKEGELNSLMKQVLQIGNLSGSGESATDSRDKAFSQSAGTPLFAR